MNIGRSEIDQIPGSVSPRNLHGVVAIVIFSPHPEGHPNLAQVVDAMDSGWASFVACRLRAQQQPENSYSHAQDDQEVSRCEAGWPFGWRTNAHFVSGASPCHEPGVAGGFQGCRIA